MTRQHDGCGRGLFAYVTSDHHHRSWRRQRKPSAHPRKWAGPRWWVILGSPPARPGGLSLLAPRLPARPSPRCGLSKACGPRMPGPVGLGTVNRSGHHAHREKDAWGPRRAVSSVMTAFLEDAGCCFPHKLTVRRWGS